MSTISNLANGRCIALVRWKSDIQDAETAEEEDGWHSWSKWCSAWGFESQDQKILQNLHKSCNKKAATWDARVKARGEELMAISETIKILNNDDALESFKKALPEKTSFLQVDSTLSLKERVRRSLRKVSGSSKTDLILMALRGKTIGFDKMIDAMKSTLKTEQENEDKKKDYCKEQFDSSDDKKRTLLLQVSNKETNIDSAKDALKMLESEIQELKDGLTKLDKDVAEATEQRKKEHEEFSEVMSGNADAQSLLKVAKKRMMQFYSSPSFVEVSGHPEQGRMNTCSKQVCSKQISIFCTSFAPFLECIKFCLGGNCKFFDVFLLCFQWLAEKYNVSSEERFGESAKRFKAGSRGRMDDLRSKR
eukprot:symbB.v1.2.024828.t3/scaffold2374.1/size162163/10